MKFTLAFLALMASSVTARGRGGKNGKGKGKSAVEEEEDPVRSTILKSVLILQGRMTKPHKQCIFLPFSAHVLEQSQRPLPMGHLRILKQWYVLLRLLHRNFCALHLASP